MEWAVNICAILSGLAGLVWLFDYFGLIKMKAIQEVVEASPTNARQPSGWLVIGMLLVTWFAVGYDIYQRRHPHNLNALDSKQWSEAANHLKLINGDLTNRTIPLDGYALTDCTMGGNILIYEGTAPTKVTCQAAPGSNMTLESNNQAVLTTMSLMNNLVKLTGGGALNCKPGNADIPLFPEQ